MNKDIFYALLAIAIFVLHRFLHYLIMGTSLDFLVVDGTNQVGFLLALIYLFWRISIEESVEKILKVK